MAVGELERLNKQNCTKLVQNWENSTMLVEKLITGKYGKESKRRNSEPRQCFIQVQRYIETGKELWLVL